MSRKLYIGLFLDLIYYKRSQLCSRNIEMNSQHIKNFKPITASNYSEHYWEPEKLQTHYHFYLSLYFI
jgi:hypothetical protein